MSSESKSETDAKLGEAKKNLLAAQKERDDATKKETAARRELAERKEEAIRAHTEVEKLTGQLESEKRSFNAKIQKLKEDNAIQRETLQRSETRYEEIKISQDEYQEQLASKDQQYESLRQEKIQVIARKNTLKHELERVHIQFKVAVAFLLCSTLYFALASKF